MAWSFQSWHRQVISGQRRGAGAALVRGGLSMVEPFYTAATTVRNAAFDRGWRTSHQAARPVVSVGNITTGGTGKTPVVRWLVQSLQRGGETPAVLLRGYKGGDEQRMLSGQLPGVIVHAEADRVAGAAAVERENPGVSVFVLDDGFQHRRLRRQFDLVLIDASNPFGFGHVLPRGLLREPLRNLARCSALLITHREAVDEQALQDLERDLARSAPAVPIFRCAHQTLFPDIEQLKARRIFAFCGIGNPRSFVRQLVEFGITPVGQKWFDDHNAYDAADMKCLAGEAQATGADALVTTAKDWVKLADLNGVQSELPPIHVAELSIVFDPAHEARLSALIGMAVTAAKNR